MFDGAIVCVVVCVCVCEWCDIRMLCNGDATAMVCIPCKCVCVHVCAAPLPSDPHECVYEVCVCDDLCVCMCVRVCECEVQECVCLFVCEAVYECGV